MPNGDATETVQFKSPTTGAVKALGADDWEEALSRGYTPVDHTVLYSPEGKRGMVPNAELRDYMKQGYQTTPETQFEQDRPGHGITMEGAGSAAWETAKGLPGGFLKLLDPTEPFRHPGDMPIVRSIREMASAAKDPNTAWWEVPVAGAGSLVGMSAQSAREHARRGEGGSIVGEAAVPIAMAIGGELASQTGLVPRAAEKAGAARESVGDAIHNPETGRMTSGAARVARTSGIIAGGGAGHLIPIPGAGSAGALAGYTLAPSILERMFPESAGRISIREAAQQTAQDELLRQEALKNPAVTSKKPLGPEPPAMRANPFEGATSSSIRTTPFAGEQTLPPTPKEAPTPMPKVKSRAEVQAEQETGKPIAVYPEPRPESPSARPGAMYSVPRTELPGAAMRGTPGAADVLRNLGEPVLFEPRGEISAPRSRILFNAQGAPIETGEAIPQGNPTPFGKSIGAPALRREVQEFATPSRAMQTPEWMAQQRSYELQKARDILRNPKATDAERAVAQSRLKESGQL
jgi:hypothetical protein